MAADEQPTLPALCGCETPKRYLDEAERMWRCWQCGRDVSPVPHRPTGGVVNAAPRILGERGPDQIHPASKPDTEA